MINFKHISLLHKYDHVLWYKIKRNLKVPQTAIVDKNKAINWYYKLFEQMFSDFLFIMELENVSRIHLLEERSLCQPKILNFL